MTSSATLAALFFHSLPVSLCSTAILRFALDRSLCDMRTAPDQCPLLVRAAWSPQAGTCFYHPSPGKREGIYSPGHPRRVSPKRGCALACLAGTLSSTGFSTGGRLLGLDGRGKKTMNAILGQLPLEPKCGIH